MRKFSIYLLLIALIISFSVFTCSMTPTSNETTTTIVSEYTGTWQSASPYLYNDQSVNNFFVITTNSVEMWILKAVDNTLVSAMKGTMSSFNNTFYINFNQSWNGTYSAWESMTQTAYVLPYEISGLNLIIKWNSSIINGSPSGWPDQVTLRSTLPSSISTATTTTTNGGVTTTTINNETSFLSFEPIKMIEYSYTTHNYTTFDKVYLGNFNTIYDVFFVGEAISGCTYEKISFWTAYMVKAVYNDQTGVYSVPIIWGNINANSWGGASIIAVKPFIIEKQYMTSKIWPSDTDPYITLPVGENNVEFPLTLSSDITIGVNQSIEQSYMYVVKTPATTTTTLAPTTTTIDTSTSSVQATTTTIIEGTTTTIDGTTTTIDGTTTTIDGTTTTIDGTTTTIDGTTTTIDGTTTTIDGTTTTIDGTTTTIDGTTTTIDGTTTTTLPAVEPIVSIVSPTNGQSFSVDDTINFECSVSDDTTPIESISVRWLLNDTTELETTKTFSASANAIGIGSHTITVEATDTDSNVTTKSISIIISDNVGDIDIDIEF